jgi:DNA ligase 1
MDSNSDVEIIEPSIGEKKLLKGSSATETDSVEEVFPKKRASQSIEVGLSSPPESIKLMLAKNRKDEDPKGWWMSEKLDGVRCYWNGCTFISRQGNPYYSPPYFINNLPKTVSLDGELWLGRKQFQECVSIARCSDNGKNDMSRWRNMKYMIFDAPSLNFPFEHRMDYIYNLVNTIDNPFIQAVHQIKCTGLENMFKELFKIEKLGGEGIMLRKPESYYEGKRSSTLLKVKTFCDAEAAVIGYEAGKGKYINLIGALKVRSEDGISFKIGSGLSDQDRVDPPPIGTKITYRYQELTKDGIPRFPTYFRKKID